MAGGHAAKMAEHDFYSHDNLTPDGPPIPTHTYASFARAVVNAWMESPGHRQNILSHDAYQIGVGLSFYWRDGGWPFFKVVQNFQDFENRQAVGKVRSFVPRR